MSGGFIDKIHRNEEPFIYPEKKEIKKLGEHVNTDLKLKGSVWPENPPLAAILMTKNPHNRQSWK